MELILSQITFDNDFFAIATPSGDTLILNKIDESLKIDSEEEIGIKTVNVEIDKEDGTVIRCPCVIGIGNEYVKLSTDYKEYEGEVLTSENMKYCTMTVYEKS